MENRAALAMLLLEHWDPVGVLGADERPEGEYLHEAEEVILILRAGGGQVELCEYRTVAGRELGGRIDEITRADRTAAAIVAWQSGLPEDRRRI